MPSLFVLICKCLLAYIMIPVTQKEIDIHLLICGTVIGYRNRNTVLPDGVPNHIYNFSGKYGLNECGMYNFSFLQVMSDYPIQ